MFALIADQIVLYAAMFDVFFGSYVFAVLLGADMFVVLPFHFLRFYHCLETLETFSHQCNHDCQPPAFSMVEENPSCAALVTKNSWARTCFVAQRSQQGALCTQSFCQKVYRN